MELRAGVNVCSVTSLVRAGTFMGRAAGTGRSPWRGDLVRGGTRSSSQTRASERERETDTDSHLAIRVPPSTSKFVTSLVAPVFRVPRVLACFRACLLAPSSLLPLRRRRNSSENPASHHHHQRRLNTTTNYHHHRYSCGRHSPPPHPPPADSLSLHNNKHRLLQLLHQRLYDSYNYDNYLPCNYLQLLLLRLPTPPRAALPIPARPTA